LIVDEFADFIDDVMVKAQLAACLEVSAYPKPGNVHRLRDYPDTRYEHFIAGSVGLGPSIRKAVVNGVRAGAGKLSLSDIGIGSLIRDTIVRIKELHLGGNTHLGIATLFIPLSASAGICMVKYGRLAIAELQRFFDEVVKSTTVFDAVNFFDAARIASAGNLGSVSSMGLPDITSDSFREDILRINATLYDLMERSSKWDLIAWEFTNKLGTCFEVGYPSLIKFYEESRDINMAIVHTYLKLLSVKPDTFIARKVGLERTSNIAEAVEIGMEVAREISRKAEHALRLGGLRLVSGAEAIIRLDEELASKKLNPGSIADILATSIFIALLFDFKF